MDTSMDDADICELHRHECGQCRREQAGVHRAAEAIARATNGALQVLRDTENALALEGAEWNREAFSARVEAIAALLAGIQLAAVVDIADQVRGESQDEEEREEEAPGHRPRLVPLAV